MRLLLDESIPSRLRRSLTEHSVRVKNGKLLALAAAEFDAFVTVDKNLPFQQNLATLPISLVVLDSFSNELSALLPLVPALLGDLASLKPKSFTLVKFA
jgi:hypothetical protein